MEIFKMENDVYKRWYYGDWNISVQLQLFKIVSGQREVDHARSSTTGVSTPALSWSQLQIEPPSFPHSAHPPRQMGGQLSQRGETNSLACAAR